MRKIIVLLLFALIACTAAPEEMNHVMPENTMKVHANKDVLDLHDFSVTFKRPDAETGKQTQLQFEIMQNGKAVQFMPLHEKLMHLILVRNDLLYFDHVHPEENNGVFTVPYTFLAPGEYRLWIEFSNGTMEHVIDYKLDVSGETIAEEPERLGDLQIAFSQPTLRQNALATLTFSITDKNGKEIPITEPLLGAAAHLIVVDSTLEEFEHAHDEKMGSSELSFSYMPESEGNYTAWIEFIQNGEERIKRFDFAAGK